jgi:signal peptidase I
MNALLSMGPTGETAPTPGWLRAVLIGRHPRRTLVRIVILVAVSYVLFGFILLPIRVRGISMLPTYRDNRANFVNRLAYLRHEPQRGDVVAIRTTGLHIMYMKRVIGLPGETVAFHDGHAYIDGRRLDEPYIKFYCEWEVPPQTLGPEEYFLVGDNRSMPSGDHFKFRAPRNRIAGKVLL